MNRTDDQAKAIMEAWRVMLRFRWRFVLTAFGVILAVLIVAMALPRKYHAEAIFDRRTDMVLTEMRNAPTSFQDPRQSVTEQLTGQPAIQMLRQTIDPVIDRKQAQGVRIDREAFYANLHRRLIVRFDVQTPSHDRVRLEYVGSDPHLARLVVNTLVENYLAQQRAEMDGRLERSAEFFRQQVERFRDVIEQTEAQRLSFEMQHDALLPNSPHGVQDRLTELRLMQAELAQRRDTALNTRIALEAELERTPDTIPQTIHSRNPDRIRMQEKVRKAEEELANNINVLRMTDRHPDLIVLREHIETMRAELEAMPEQIVTQTQVARNPKRDELELKLAIARAETSALEVQQQSIGSQIAQLDAEADQLHPVRADYRKLTREVDEAQRRLNMWEESLWRVELSRTAESGNHGVRLDFVKPCPPIGRPVSPALFQVLAGALGLGVLAGAMSVFFAYRTDETIRDGQELTTTFNLPLMGSVSEIITRHRLRMRRLRNAVLYPVNLTAMAAIILAVAAVLYLNLERPALYAELKENPAQFLRDRLAERRERDTVAPDRTSAGRDDAESNTPMEIVSLELTDPRDLADLR